MHIPLNFNLRGKRVLLVGAGVSACEKLALLSKSDCDLTIVAKSASADFESLLQSMPDDSYRLHLRQFEESDLDQQMFLFVAINDTEQSREIADRAKKRGLLVNSACHPEQCDFYTTSLITRGKVQLSIATDGQFAGLSAALRRHFEWALPEEHNDDWETIFRLRSELIQANKSSEERRKILKSIIQKIENEYLSR